MDRALFLAMSGAKQDMQGMRVHALHILFCPAHSEKQRPIHFLTLLCLFTDLKQKLRQDVNKE